MSQFAVSPRSIGSERVTRGVRVRVSPAYLPARSEPSAKRYVFGYRIRIENQSGERVRLLSRRWVIVDAQAGREDVTGPGVVGQQPVLADGETFEYSSHCPLRTRWGTMEGAFTFATDAGEEFEAEVARFYLVAPEDA